MSPASLAGLYVALVIALAVGLSWPLWRDEPDWDEEES